MIHTFYAYADRFDVGGISTKPFACVVIDDRNGGVGLSVCNKKDHFTKKIGRKIALKRLENKVDYRRFIPNREVIVFPDVMPMVSYLEDFINCAKYAVIDYV